MKRVTVVGASWGGQFSLSHMIDYNAELESSVHVCPVLPYFAADVLKRIKVTPMCTMIDDHVVRFRHGHW